MMKKCISILLALGLMLAAMPVLAEVAMDEPRFGPFEAEDLGGEGLVTEDIFADAKITLINYWATWCGPCIQELPDLAKLSDMTDGRVQVISVLLDAMDMRGERDEGAIEAMKLLAEDAGVAYPVLYPDAFLMAVSSLATSIPTTFIVDERGVLQTAVVGSRNAEQWIAVAQQVADTVYTDEPVKLVD